jgi:hypothetical protein
MWKVIPILSTLYKVCVIPWCTLCEIVQKSCRDRSPWAYLYDPRSGDHYSSWRWVGVLWQMHLTPGLLDFESSKSLLHPLRIPITRCWKTVTQVIWIWQKCLYDMESRKRKKSPPIRKEGVYKVLTSTQSNFVGQLPESCHSVVRKLTYNHIPFLLLTHPPNLNHKYPVRRTVTSTVNIQNGTIQKVRPVRTTRCALRSETWRRKSTIMTTRNRFRRICWRKGKGVVVKKNHGSVYMWEWGVSTWGGWRLRSVGDPD